MRRADIDIRPASAKDQASGGDEQRCEAAGALIRRALPDVPPAPAAGSSLPPSPTPSWGALRAALAGGAAERGARGDVGRRRLLIPALASGLVVAAIVILAARGPALRYEVEGGSLADSGRVETAAGQVAVVRFSDGSSIALGGDSTGRVTSRAPDGATFALDRGRAAFDVVHRPRTRWRVAAGPFEIQVTGTRFDVSWSGDGPNRAFQVDLHAGSVIVRGALAGDGVPLRAGQRLTARLDRDSLAVVDTAPAVAPGLAAAPAAAPAPPAAAAAAAEPVPESMGTATPGADRRRARRDRTAADEVIDVAPAAPDIAPRPGGWPRRSGSGMYMSTDLAAGGTACLDWAPQIRFDDTIGGSYATSITALALSHAVQDHTRSWCGAGALRADATFDVLGAPNHINVRPHEVGSVVVKLGSVMDFTGKTVSAHIYIDASPDVVFAAQVFVINGRNKWVGGGPLPGLSPGRWLTISSRTYERENPVFEGGTSPVNEAQSLAVQIYADGKLRAWTGKVFVDDIGWR